MAPAKRPIPEGYSSITPVLTYEDCKAALDWYTKALGAQELSRNFGPDGKVMHAEFRVGNSRIMAHDAMMGGKGPKGLGGSPVALWLFVEDCDAVFGRAIAAGATEVRPCQDQFWGDRLGTFKDPHGYAWNVATRKEDLTPQEMETRGREFFKQFAQSGGGKS